MPSFDQQMDLFISELESYFVTRIASMKTRTGQAPILITSIQSAEICLEMLSLMKQDREVLQNLMGKYQRENKLEEVKATNEVLLHYTGGYLINLTAILKVYSKIMTLVVESLPIPPHKSDRDNIIAKNNFLGNLTKDFVWQQGFFRYFSYLARTKLHWNWQELLVGNLIDSNQPVYKEILDGLTREQLYSYKQLLFKINSYIIRAKLYESRLDEGAHKEKSR